MIARGGAMAAMGYLLVKASIFRESRNVETTTITSLRCQVGTSSLI